MTGCTWTEKAKHWELVETCTKGGERASYVPFLKESVRNEAAHALQLFLPPLFDNLLLFPAFHFSHSTLVPPVSPSHLFWSLVLLLGCSISWQLPLMTSEPFTYYRIQSEKTDLFPETGCEQSAFFSQRVWQLLGTLLIWLKEMSQLAKHKRDNGDLKFCLGSVILRINL